MKNRLCVPEPTGVVSHCWRRACFRKRSNLASFDIAKLCIEKSSNPSPKATGVVGTLSSRHLYASALLLFVLSQLSPLKVILTLLSSRSSQSLQIYRETCVRWLESTTGFLSGVSGQSSGLCSKHILFLVVGKDHLCSVSHFHKKMQSKRNKGGVTVLLSRLDIGLHAFTCWGASVLLAACKQC